MLLCVLLLVVVVVIIIIMIIIAACGSRGLAEAGRGDLRGTARVR